MIETPTPLWNQYIIIKNFRQYPIISSLLNGYEGKNLIGYTYIDHEQGITLDISKLFTGDNGEFTITKDLIADNSRAILRFEQFSKTDFEVANTEIVQLFNLEAPDYIQQYNRDDLASFREHPIYQNFSANGFPDDISIFLIDETHQYKTENIWVRVEYFDAKKQAGIAKLLVQPFQKLKVNKGDSIIFKLIEVKEGDMGLQPFGFILNKETPETKEATKPSQEKESKKWWKFW